MGSVSFDMTATVLKRTHDQLGPSKCAGHETEQKKRQQNAVSDVLVRQQLLAGLNRACSIGSSHSEYALWQHIQTCNSTDCFYGECSLGKKCLAHFRKCTKQDCIMCIEARLNQVADSNEDASDEDKFVFSSWRARLQSVNDETKEYVPYFNECARDVATSRASKSPFIRAAMDRLHAAKSLVSQSEAKYATLCTEVYARWSILHAGEDLMSTDAASSTEESSSCGTQSPRPDVDTPTAENKRCSTSSSSSSTSVWPNMAEEDKDMRQCATLQIVARLQQQGSTASASSSSLLEEAQRMEAAIYAAAKSRNDYLREVSQ